MNSSVLLCFLSNAVTQATSEWYLAHDVKGSLVILMWACNVNCYSFEKIVDAKHFRKHLWNEIPYMQKDIVHACHSLSILTRLGVLLWKKANPLNAILP